MSEDRDKDCAKLTYARVCDGRITDFKTYSWKHGHHWRDSFGAGLLATIA
jgi:hypothetical protein